MDTGEVQPDARSVPADPDADLEQPETQGIELHLRHVQTGEPARFGERALGGAVRRLGMTAANRAVRVRCLSASAS